jgi:hypothetical protein
MVDAGGEEKVVLPVFTFKPCRVFGFFNLRYHDINFKKIMTASQGTPTLNPEP